MASSSAREHGRTFLGEFLGTFVLVLFGCGAVATAVLFGAHQGLMQVALAWGISVALAIYLTRHLSCAHLNPAVSLAMTLAGRMAPPPPPPYAAAQFAGAITGGATILLLFGPSISAFESAHGIIRGSEASVRTAMLFGEFYPNPGMTAAVSMPLAIGAEALGTFLLVLLIFALTEGCNVGRPGDALAPAFIGLSVTSLIALLAPLTQAGFNPARDAGPRLIAWLAGWGAAALPDNAGGFFWVYILAPLTGASAAALFFTRIMEPLLNGKPPSPGQGGDGCC